MLKFQNKIILVYAFIAATLYSGAAGIFIYYQSYVQSWLLYIGNALFGIVIAFFLFRYYKSSNYTLRISQLVVAGQITGVMGIIISCLICLLLIAILTPGIFIQAHHNSNVLKNPPGQLQQGRNSFLLLLLIDAVVGNIGTGSFIAILFPFTIIRNQKGE